MDDFLKMDVFFVVTTAVVILGGVLGVVALFYVVRILKSFDHLMKNVSEESDDVRKDFGILRTKIRDEGMKWQHLSNFFFGVRSRSKAREGKHKTHHDN